MDSKLLVTTREREKLEISIFERKTSEYVPELIKKTQTHRLENLSKSQGDKYRNQTEK